MIPFCPRSKSPNPDFMPPKDLSSVPTIAQSIAQATQASIHTLRNLNISVPTTWTARELHASLIDDAMLQYCWETIALKDGLISSSESRRVSLDDTWTSAHLTH